MSQGYPEQPPSSGELRPQLPPMAPPQQASAPFPQQTYAQYANPSYPAPQQVMPQGQAPFAQPPQYMGQPPFAQPQMAYTPQGPMPYMAQQTNVVVNVQHQGPGFLVRALYFIFIGWWAGLFWLNVGYFLCMTVILLPFGLIMLNRLPQVMTLRPSGQQTSVSVSTSGGTTNVTVNIGGTQQYSMLIRAIYFILVGWWAGLLWAYLAYFLCISIFLLPVGLIMFNNMPLVLTLRRN
jgi:uncharacterized membrane protein YccF (DUF307 family)